MGLDWVLHRYRPKAGQEKTFATRQKKLEALAETEADEAALEKAREALREVSHTPQEDLGSPPDTDGRAGGSFLVSELDCGAGIIRHCGDVLDGDLESEAWVDHSAAEAADYAERLDASVRAAKSPNALARERLKLRAAIDGPCGPRLAFSGEPPSVEVPQRGTFSFDEQRATVDGLVRWLRFWSKKGYGFRAWS